MIAVAEALALVGRPYASPGKPPITFDCWDLVCWVCGSNLDVEKSEYALIADAVDAERARWRRVDEPRPGDLALMAGKHCGVYLGTGIGILHACPTIRSVRLSSSSVVRRAVSLEWFRR